MLIPFRTWYENAERNGNDTRMQDELRLSELCAHIDDAARTRIAARRHNTVDLTRPLIVIRSTRGIARLSLA